MLKEKLTEALNNKKYDVNSFIWKERKVFKGQEIVQDSKRLIDCTQDELKEHYNHCETMLYNKNPHTPGRYILLNIVKEQREKCNAELFVRWLEKFNGISRYSFMSTLREFLNNNPTFVDENGEEIDTKKISISKIINNTPSEFLYVKVEDVLSACLDSLGLFNKEHLTKTFLLKQGVYLTEEDNKNRGKNIKKLDYIREYLGLHKDTKVRIDYRGLTLDEMRSMLNLRSKKYFDMSTLQLELLRNKILFSLENDINFHIAFWKELERQIKLVAHTKGYSL